MASPRVQRMSNGFSRTGSGSSRLQALAALRSSSLTKFDRDSLSDNAPDAAAAQAASRAAIEEFKNDKIFSKFLVDDFDATQFAAVGGSLGSGGMQRSTASQGTGVPIARESLWQRVGTCMDQLHRIVVAVWHLQRVLAKKRDPISHVGFLDEVMQAGDPMLTDRVWVRSYASQMKSAFTASSFVEETFVVGYLKLLGMVDGLVERLFRDTDVKGVPSAIKPEARDQLVAALEPFQTAYLGKSLGRISELVNSMFATAVHGSVPTRADF